MANLQQSSHDSGMASDPRSPFSSDKNPKHIIEDFTFSQELLADYYPQLKGDCGQKALAAIYLHMDILRRTYPELSILKGKRILDLACGARQCPENQRYSEPQVVFDPWMSRALLKLGAYPLGVDICSQLDEKFDSLTLDLTIMDALVCIKDASFDACYIAGFPPIYAIRAFTLQGIVWDELKQNITFHMQRCLKHDGKNILGLADDDDRFVADALQHLSLRHH